MTTKQILVLIASIVIAVLGVLADPQAGIISPETASRLTVAISALTGTGAALPAKKKP